MTPKPSSSSPLPSPAKLLHYDADFQVLICTHCQYAIQPDALSRHLKEIHHIYRSARRPYLDAVRGLALTNDVATPAESDFPVPHLAVFQGGLKCEASGCDYLCLSAKRMEMHWPAVHRCRGERGRDWSRVPLQTFFRGTRIRYFSGPRRVQPGDDDAVRLKDGGRRVMKMRKTPKDALVDAHQLDGLDAMILEHYFSSTHKSFLIGPEAEHVWLSVVPRLACDHTFVLQGVLAFTALHMCHLDHPRRPELLLRAFSHKDASFPAFRHSLQRPDKDNCDAILVFAYLLLVMSLGGEAAAACHDDQDPLLLVRASDVDERLILPQWLHLLRSGCSMLGPCWQFIKVGPVSPLLEGFHHGPVNEEVMQLYLARFLSLIPSDSSWSPSATTTYRAAANELAMAFASANYDWPGRTEHVRTFNILALFPLRVDEDFLVLLVQNHDAALLLMAHYCILLRKLEAYWYFTGRAERLFAEVEKKMLGRRWEGVIREVGAVVRAV